MIFKANKRAIIYALILFPYFRPNSIPKLFPQLNRVYNVIWICLAAAAVLLQIKKRAKKLNRALVYTACFFTYILAVTTLTGSAVIMQIFVMSVCIGIMCYIDLFSEHPKDLLDALLFNLELLIYSNAVSMLLFPGGMYLSNETFGSPNNWLLGYDNHWFIYYFAAYGLAAIRLHYHKRSVRSIIMIVVLHITTLYVFSGVLVIGIGLMDLFYLFRMYRHKWFSLKASLITGLTLFAVVVFGSYWSIVSSLVNVMNKSRSFSARINIWHIALDSFSSHPIFGIGRQAADSNTIRYDLPAGVNAHSMWVEILFEGGLIAFILFLAIFVSLIIRTRKKGFRTNNAIYKLSLPALFAMMITISVDSILEIRGVMFFALLALIYCSREMTDKLERLPQKETARKRAIMYISRGERTV